MVCNLFCCRQSRSTFDTTETKREIGPVIIDFNAIQTKVNLKYDTLQKAIVQQFGTRLGEDISDFYSTPMFKSEDRKNLLSIVLKQD